MKELNEQHIERLVELIDAKDREQVMQLVTDLHPADIAEIVSDLDACAAVRMLF